MHVCVSACMCDKFSLVGNVMKVTVTGSNPHMAP